MAGSNEVHSYVPSYVPFDQRHHEGLLKDLAQHQRMADAQRALKLRRLAILGAASSAGVVLFGCGGGGSSPTTSTPVAPSPPTSPPATPPASTPGTPPASGSCSQIPTETGGPFPADGTNNNGLSVLTTSGVLRSDIRSSFGSLSGTATGVPLTIALSIQNSNASCASLEGYAVYMWHCDAAGGYSLYSQGVTNQNYLRGVQISNAAGLVQFTSIYPACYSGRWPHIHFEIFRTAAAATSGNAALKTSQLALPAAQSQLVYASSGYAGSTNNFNSITLASDNVFSDGTSLQMATVTGSVAAGFAASLNVAVAA